MHKYYYIFRGAFLMLAFCCASLYPLSTLAQCDFQEVAETQNITHQFGQGLLGSGVSFMDFDGDGWDDLTFGTSEGETVEVYRNNQGQFEKISLQGVVNTCESKQITWVDFDNDGDKDLYYSCVGDNLVLYRNDGDLTFTDVTDEMGLQSPIASALGSNWADFDRDGWLDLYATYYGGTRSILFRNLGGTGFENITTESNAAPSIKPTFCGVVFDYDNDGWEDIYLANDRSTRNDLIRNNGDLTFEDVSSASKADLPMDAMGTTLLDINHDGFFEVYISNSPEGNALIFNNGDGTFTDIAESSGTFFGSVGWGVNTLDFDNDGRSDLYVSGSEIGTTVKSSALYRAISDSEFELTAFPGMAIDTMSSFSNAVGDFNRDGRMDIAVSNSNGTKSQLWQNSCTDTNHWLKVQLQGTLSNRDGIGSRVIAFVNGSPLYQYRAAGVSFMAQNSGYLHFGLAENTKVDSLLVEWPSGLTDLIENPEIDQIISITEGEMYLPLPINEGEANDPLCEGESLTLSFELYGEGLDILWSNGSTESSITVHEDGTYFAFIAKGDVLVCTEEYIVNFGDFPDVTVATTPASETAMGSITITENNGANSYRWSHNSQETSNELTGLEAGTYQVLITTVTGCELSLTIEVERSIVTSLDDPLTQSIAFRYESGELEIDLPSQLRIRLRETQISTGEGLILSSSKHSTGELYPLRVKGIPDNQMIIVNLLFTDGRLVRKMMFVK